MRDDKDARDVRRILGIELVEAARKAGVPAPSYEDKRAAPQPQRRDDEADDRDLFWS